MWELDQKKILQPFANARESDNSKFKVFVYELFTPLCKGGTRRKVAASREEIFRRLSEGEQVNQQAAEPIENNSQHLLSRS